ncbi:MAG: GNAT family N-acetyltransferase [Lachnospiraceae bacterium]
MLCNQDSFDKYEPYIDFDVSPCPIQVMKKTPILNNSGIRLYSDQNTSALYLLSHSNKLIGFCSAFSYMDKDNSIIYELSVMIAPAYRRHRLGTFILSAMISEITESHNTLMKDTAIHDCPAFLLLAGNNEYFAQRNGFEYSHSEHFMQREPFFVISKNACCSCMTLSCGMTNDTHISVKRHACREQGHYVYRLFSDGTSAARCTVYECSDYINIANVYTNIAFRGRGLAGCLIDCAARDFPDKKLLLQVSGSNTAAIHAYTKTGFEFIKTYDYYKAEL